MIYLSGAVTSDLPAMLTPAIGNRLVEGQIWAADSGCFAPKPRKRDVYSDERYLGWLERLRPFLATCLFATAPDVYGDADATLELSAPMYARIRELGYRVALVAQPELSSDAVPWDEIDALFVGGPWRGSERSNELAADAQARGKWTHLGRVNSARWFLAAVSAGYDSADGTFLRYGRDANRKRLDGWLEKAERSIWNVARSEPV